MNTILSIIFNKAYAAAPVLEPTGAIGATNENTLNTSIGNFASLSIGWLYALAGAIAFIYIIILGIKYITSNGDPQKAGEARTGIINIIIGIVIVVATYAIIKFSISVGELLKKQVSYQNLNSKHNNQITIVTNINNQNNFY